ncbi:HTH-type transcriptional regulator DmlR [Pseudidiomarina piscicola]|uniref:HTH-type transcriptional regulator DmlR n=1 Tax=Pseudidiomarina piscicola TaxID=2614830 RepID=A0A6S6WQX1_9GAMM|nr:LysR family transcriptional regulator [Pseudidiomarina piscicola]CAB0150233.1 HTH-type transcriptional regulator DmlR [Pseudidiomarina piscicola]VZT39664.1 HTH-type transcriptional regulator DmlR [Pseudomonas aeruginosa]
MFHKWNDSMGAIAAGCVMSLPDLTNYLIFARVVRAGSISAGARALEMPKSTVSRRLTELEEEQGVRLVHRTRSGLKLTDIGQAFLIHCEAVESATEAAQQVTQQVRDIPRGRVKVSSPYALSQSLLTELLPVFMQRYPEVDVQLFATNRPVSLVDEGVDVALRVRSSIEDSSLIARPLSDSPSTLYGAPELIARYGIPKHPLDLLQFPHLSLHYTSGRYGYQLLASDGEQLTVSFQPRLVTDDMLVLRQAAVQGQGLVALPNYLCAEAVAAGQLQQVLPDWQLPVGIMHLVYPHRRGLLPAVRVFIDFMVEHIPALAQRSLLIG